MSLHTLTSLDENAGIEASQWPASFRLNGELALITGGGSGLGLGMARCMAAAGARVILAGRRLDVLRKSAAAIGSSAIPMAFDVVQSATAPDFISKIEKEFGPLTILVNNAGIHLKKPAVDTTEQEFMEVLNTHVLGAHALSRAAARSMVQQRKGSILFIASMASLFGIPNVVAYSAAKSAYLGMVRSMAVELSPLGVRVNAIAPGWIDSEITRKAMNGDPQRKQRIISRTPMARFGEAEDIGMAAVYLCSPAARFVTGVCLPVDGGASIGF